MSRPATLGELKKAGYRPRSVRREMRENLLARMGGDRPLFEGIIGYDETVIPELENGVISGHHMVLLGERGQAKTRLIRSLVSLLDEFVPVVEGCEINDDPYAPVCARCRRLVARRGDATEVAWLGREARYGEKLATPDLSIADLIGEIDPVKIAEGRYLSDQEALHFGIVARSNRGIFAVNELPDMTEKVQVGLFNLMEERDLQIRGHKVRLPLDLIVVATANPEDYTSRGRIITPLKDRFGAQIRTHYPRTVVDEMAIMEQEAELAEGDGRSLRVPWFIKEIIARFSIEARAAPEVNQTSGVSVRVSVSNYETVVANAEKRAVRCGEGEVVPRISDLHALAASAGGKIELEYGFEEDGELPLIDRLLDVAVKAAFDSRVDLSGLESVSDYITGGWGVVVSDVMPSEEYVEGIASLPGLREALDAIGPFESPGLMASAAEFLLEGLHLHEKLNRLREGGRFTYQA